MKLVQKEEKKFLELTNFEKILDENRTLLIFFRFVGCMLELSEPRLTHGPLGAKWYLQVDPFHPSLRQLGI